MAVKLHDRPMDRNYERRMIQANQYRLDPYYRAPGYGYGVPQKPGYDDIGVESSYGNQFAYNPQQQPYPQPRAARGSPVGILKLLVIIFFVLVAIAMAAVAIWLAVAKPWDTDYTIEYNVVYRINSTYSSDLDDPSDVAFKTLETEFCQAMQSIFKKELEECTVYYFAEGTIYVYAGLRFRINRLEESVRKSGSLVTEPNTITYIWHKIADNSGDYEVLASPGSGVVTVNGEDGDGIVDYGVCVNFFNMRYDDDFDDLNSDESKEFESSFCDVITAVKGFEECEVTNLKSDEGMVTASAVVGAKKSIVAGLVKDDGSPATDDNLEKQAGEMLKDATDDATFFTFANDPVLKTMTDDMTDACMPEEEEDDEETTVAATGTTEDDGTTATAAAVEDTTTMKAETEGTSVAAMSTTAGPTATEATTAA